MNAELNYLIPVGDDHFAIGNKSGQITTNTALDREQQDSWVITGERSQVQHLCATLMCNTYVQHSCTKLALCYIIELCIKIVELEDMK